MDQVQFKKNVAISLTHMYFICFFLFLGLSESVVAQSYACSELSIVRDYDGNKKRKSYAVSGLYLKFTESAIKIFGNYRGRYLSNEFTILKTEGDTIYADGGLIKSGSIIKMTFQKNILTSNYNIVDDDGESRVTLILTLKPAQNHFSEKYHKRKETQQKQAGRRDLLGREKK